MAPRSNSKPLAEPRLGRRLSPRLTPQGRLFVVAADDAPELDPARAAAIESAFTRGTGHGLIELGARNIGDPLPAAFAWWRDFAARFMTALCSRGDAAEARELGTYPDLPDRDVIAAMLRTVPLMVGAEYFDDSVFVALWTELGDAVDTELRESGASLTEFLKRLDPAWNVVGRVHFNLAENRRDQEAPFAFLATYTNRLGAGGKVQHQQLGQALVEFAGAAKKERLLSLLMPVQRAAEQCAWLRAMIERGEVFHPLRWTPAEAFRLLQDAPQLERAGVVLRMPATWRSMRPKRPVVRGTVGSSPATGLGQAALLDFRAEVTLDGEPLTAAEINQLLANTDGFALLRGQWVEVDRERIDRALARFQAAEELAAAGKLTFADAMRLLAGADLSASEDDDAATATWAGITAGPWLAERLAGLRSPEGLSRVHPGRELHATLRPYQEAGVRWLHLCSELGLGACLADDMGLGKTIQVLALLLVLRKERDAKKRPATLLVAPASLLGNWAAEVERFAPSLTLRILHPSAMRTSEFAALSPKDLAGVDLAMTTYGTLQRLGWLANSRFDIVVLDEAQAIKNPGTKQTRAVKALKARARIALTGTPIENRLGDLWSLFDFLAPGLLGSAKEFSRYTKRLDSGGADAHGPLRELVRPYILRRLKTDKSVIADLPEKTELKAFCSLSRRQAALYQDSVTELGKIIEENEGIQRRGVVLAFLMRFKQICNHPSHWLADGGWDPNESGKFARLREIADIVAEKQEKMLVFTQFRETTAPLARFLAGIFGRDGLVLHGETPVRDRKGLVDRFQNDESIPFFVLSLKAGGTGLNLTAASHVVHFDRWWNPAVENQATDRAFRIGQKRNVLVHKFVCRGTVEEKIDAMIDSKKQLAHQVLSGAGELDLTSLSDSELMRLVALDLGATQSE